MEKKDININASRSGEVNIKTSSQVTTLTFIYSIVIYICETTFIADSLQFVQAFQKFKRCKANTCGTLCNSTSIL